MIKLYIPSIDFTQTNKLQLFVLTRPFYKKTGWVNDLKIQQRWNISYAYQYTSNIAEATLFLLPLPVNYYIDSGQRNLLQSYHELCLFYKIKGYGFISGDFGKAYPEFSTFTYFRMGGFKRQLSNKNLGFPASLSDHFQNIYKLEDPIPRPKTTVPVIGFCGHATGSPIKRTKEVVKCLLENTKRFIQNPFRKDWEPLFASAYERWQLLQLLEHSQDLHTQFIYRNHYRGGALTEEEQHATTLDYYDNLLQSDYVLCLRGAGNFSIRFYETLMMGKIPIFVNTDCLLPLANDIDWKEHVVWVEWHERYQIASKVVDFHKTISQEAFMELQIRNRKLWKEQLTVGTYLQKLANAL